MRRPPGRNPDQGGKRVPAHGRQGCARRHYGTKILVLPSEQPHRRGDGQEDLEAIADVLRGTNIIVLSDELYAVLTYTGRRHVSIANIGHAGAHDRSKRLFQGLRHDGLAAGIRARAKDIIKTMTKIHQFAIMSAPTMAQDATVVALQPETDGAVQEDGGGYNMRRRLLLSAASAGWGSNASEPLGAFYVFPSIAKFGLPARSSASGSCTTNTSPSSPAALSARARGFARISYARACAILKRRWTVWSALLPKSRSEVTGLVQSKPAKLESAAQLSPGCGTTAIPRLKP